MTTTAPIRGVLRPDQRFLWTSLLASFAWGPLFPIGMVRAVLRFRTLEYQFDDEGIHMAWGILFRREVTVAYRRIQDIHLTSNIFERWLGLARIQLQTASGSAAAEMTIEGLLEFERIRDDLYRQMRGATPTPTPQDAEPLALVAAALRETTAELAQLRALLMAQRQGEPPAGAPQ
jgi:putative membrane protein